MNPSDDARFEVLHGHYGETFSNIELAVKKRDRLFSLILVFLAVFLLQLASPAETEKTLSIAVGAKLGLKDPVPISVLGSVLWLAVAAFVVRYYQSVIHLERNYTYIHLLEQQLASFYKKTAFTREGESYLKKYSSFSQWVWWLHMVAFPILMVFALGSKWTFELFDLSLPWAQRIFDTLAFFAVVISTVLYMRQVHSDNEKPEDAQQTAESDR